MHVSDLILESYLAGMSPNENYIQKFKMGIFKHDKWNILFCSVSNIDNCNLSWKSVLKFITRTDFMHLRVERKTSFTIQGLSLLSELMSLHPSMLRGPYSRLAIELTCVEPGLNSEDTVFFSMTQTSWNWNVRVVKIVWCTECNYFLPTSVVCW